MEQQPNQPYTVPVLTPAEEEHKRRATTVMILGIIGVSIFFLPLVNIAGFVLSIIALVKAKDNRRYAMENGIKENGMNTTGYICGIVGIILGAMGVLVTVIAIIFLVILTVGVVSAAGPALADTLTQVLPEIADAMESAAGSLSALL